VKDVRFYRPALPKQAWEWATRQARPGAHAGVYTKGKQHDLLVEELASFLGMNEERIILTGSGCTALAVVARALRNFCRPDPEFQMGVPAFGYRGTALSMRMGGWDVRLEDVARATWCRDVRFDYNIRCQTDIFGNPATVSPNAIVDSAHSLATANKRRRRGGAECFSLAATKMVTGGEGGVIVMNKWASLGGIEEVAALFSRLDEMNAALARWHLKRVDDLLEARMPAWDHYRQHVPYAQQSMRRGFTPSVFAFLPPDREAFLQANEKSGVEFKLYYSDSDPPAGCPTAKRIADSVVAIPLFDDVPFKTVIKRLTFP
jgi:dTDP-4-amino-4,6-dideoxygalactose transaminase